MSQKKSKKELENRITLIVYPLSYAYSDHFFVPVKTATAAAAEFAK